MNACMKNEHSPLQTLRSSWEPSLILKPWKLPLWENERGDTAAVLLGHSNPLIMFLQTGYLVPMENVSVPRPKFSPRQRYKCLWANGRDVPQRRVQGYFLTIFTVPAPWTHRKQLTLFLLELLSLVGFSVTPTSADFHYSLAFRGK